jgi:hypothetical protein
VAPECALHHTVELLKKLVAEFSEFQLFFVTPIPATFWVRAVMQTTM